MSVLELPRVRHLGGRRVDGLAPSAQSFPDVQDDDVLDPSSSYTCRLQGELRVIAMPTTGRASLREAIPVTLHPRAMSGQRHWHCGPSLVLCGRNALGGQRARTQLLEVNDDVDISLWRRRASAGDQARRRHIESGFHEVGRHGRSVYGGKLLVGRRAGQNGRTVVIYRTPPFELLQFNWLISQVASMSMPAAPTRVNRYDFRDLSLRRSRRPGEPVHPIKTASYA